ncbi:MAG: DUF1194 domain-containing protein [Rhodospirillaceae bacterium]|mgnify:FL=1|nr:DUF1194 domain-containing protein [Rhodospirillaceae bacterium]
MIIVLCQLLFAGSSLAAPIEVELELVLLVDVSSSVDSMESRLQRKGYVDAMTDASVLAAIKKTRLGRIAVTYIEWSSGGKHSVVAPWFVIEDFASAFAFATMIEAAPRSFGHFTSIGGALKFAIPLFEHNNIRGERRAIDISADGPNNDGPSPHIIRDIAVASGITINGLPIVNDRLQSSGMKQMPNYDHYFADCVIGGASAFMVIADDYQDFARAIKKKLIFEVAGRVPPEFKLWAQKSFLMKTAGHLKSNCDLGIDYQREGTSKRRTVY